MKYEWDEKKGLRTMSFEKHIYDYYEAQGYFFPREVITRYFLSLKTKPFVILTGISGTGKTKIAQVFAEYMCQDEKPEDKKRRYAFIPVRPDWMDNKGLLGYYNLLDESYYATPLISLLIQAEKNPDKPYFIILDEMNLAKVEQYFSDFLSITESRTSENLSGEQLCLHSATKAKTPDGLDIPQRISIPPNVYFTGTVNVDESTYMFSPKVLDRANVIEFNDVDLANYEKGIASADGCILKEQDVREKLLPMAGETPFCNKANYTRVQEMDSDTGEYLSKILAILHPHQLHFGYRVVNEIARFILHANNTLNDFNLEDTLDIQILQKILPKFHGTQAKLEDPLGKLLAFCNGVDSEEIPEDAPFPRSAQKLVRMIRNLKIQGYTSFIE
jgi:5-methylcytosine-specific restriction endonuclease McrBC GTP-binding regulatory subunit McrB